MNAQRHISEAEIEDYVVEAFHELGRKRVSEVHASYYPYSGINHTIRVRNGRIFARISASCTDIPRNAMKGLVFMLVAKLLRKRIDPEWRDLYNRAIETPEMEERAKSSRRVRGRRNVASPSGDVYDLEEVFERMNREYFGGHLKKPELGWSASKTYRTLGQHDSTHGMIIVSKSLDDASVPSYIVDYIVFHEMLHIAHPTKIVNGRRMNHTTAFRRDEKKFRHYRAAENWIEENAAKIRRKVRREQRERKSRA